MCNNETGITLETYGHADYVFKRLAFERGLARIVRDNWRSEADPAALLGQLNPPLFEASDGSKRNHEVIVDFAGSLLMLEYRRGYGSISVEIATSPEENADSGALIARVRQSLPPVIAGSDSVPFVFWYAGARRPVEARTRRLVVPGWHLIERNYPRATRDVLGSVMTAFDRESGKLLLWHGRAGTGKTTAVRGLASEWRDWCRFEYVTDPERFFGTPAYMMHVLLEESDDDERSNEGWRCLVLEDTGEMLAADAKFNEGQRLSRLLNLVDGLIGQGLRIMVLVTTNERLGSLHAAVSRPGRCASVVEFASFGPAEAEEWLGAGVASPSMTLAELYALQAGRPRLVPVIRTGFALRG